MATNKHFMRISLKERRNDRSASMKVVQIIVKIDTFP